MGAIPYAMFDRVKLCHVLQHYVVSSLEATQQLCLYQSFWCGGWAGMVGWPQSHASIVPFRGYVIMEE